MKFIIPTLLALAALTLATPTPNAAPEAEAIAAAGANPLLEKRVGEDCKVARRFLPDKHGTCVDTRRPVCQGGTLYKGKCPGAEWNICCIS